MAASYLLETQRTTRELQTIVTPDQLFALTGDIWLLVIY